MKSIRASMMTMLLALAACTKPAASPEQAVNSARAEGATESSQPTPAENAARAAAATASDDAPYYTKLPLKEFMPHVMQYAGDGIWKRQGYRSDKTGLHSLFPKNDEEWEEAESGARTLAEVTNVLLIPGRRVPDPDWDKAVLSVRAVALRAAEAAEKHDEDAFFKAGGDLDVACDECHKKFDPTFKRQPA